VRFRQAQREIEVLEEQAKAGDRVLAYVDEAGFECIHPNRSAWTDRGQVHEIEATRGKRLNVLGAMLSTGEMVAAKLWETTKAQAFVGFLGLLAEKVQGKPITVILDNASIHKAKEIKPLVEFLETKGLKLYFLPAYSPELNRIERLWHKMKHTWLTPKCRDKQTLEADVEEIVDNYGSKYQFSFYVE
jgi:transposase